MSPVSASGKPPTSATVGNVRVSARISESKRKESCTQTGLKEGATLSSHEEPSGDIARYEAQPQALDTKETSDAAVSEEAVPVQQNPRAAHPGAIPEEKLSITVPFHNHRGAVQART